MYDLQGIVSIFRQSYCSVKLHIKKNIFMLVFYDKYSATMNVRAVSRQSKHYLELYFIIHQGQFFERITYIFKKQILVMTQYDAAKIKMQFYDCPIFAQTYFSMKVSSNICSDGVGLKFKGSFTNVQLFLKTYSRNDSTQRFSATFAVMRCG